MATTNKLMNAELARLFKRFDRNKDGYIDEQEFGLLLQQLGDDLPDETVSLHFAAIDDNDDSVVDYTEFVAWWLDHAAV